MLGLGIRMQKSLSKVEQTRGRGRIQENVDEKIGLWEEFFTQKISTLRHCY